MKANDFICCEDCFIVDSVNYESEYNAFLCCACADTRDLKEEYNDEHFVPDEYDEDDFEHDQRGY